MIHIMDIHKRRRISLPNPNKPNQFKGERDMYKPLSFPLSNLDILGCIEKAALVSYVLYLL